MKTVYLSIGSNLGDRRGRLARAIKTMDSMDALGVTAISSLYETAPYGPVEQDNFYNACVRLNTTLEADDLLTVLQGIEISAEREKDEVWGPRTLDLDIIWMEDSEMYTDRLTIPHKEAKNRLFVLEPLKEIWQEGLFDGEEIDDIINQLKTDPEEDDQSVTFLLKHWVEEYGLDRDSHDKIESAVRDILDAVGEDPDRPGLKETPARVARMYEEVFHGLIEPPFDDFKLFDSDNTDDMVVVKDIEFYSMCEHHLLPFYGNVHVAYIPSDRKVLGLSKFARLVRYAASRPNVQEDLTVMIGEALDKHIPVEGVAVAIEAEHMCMTMRGAKSPDSSTNTYYFSGVFDEDEDTKNDFLKSLVQ